MSPPVVPGMVSVVVPVYNEEDNVGPLLAALETTLEGLGRPYELLLVDDGSTDATAARQVETGRQNDPADIPRLIDALKDGYDVVSGWRRDRQDTFWTRRLPSRVANALISWITGVHLHDYGCALKVYRREILQDIALYGEMHRFLPALARWVGASVGELAVTHWPRRSGVSKYGLGRTVRVLLDLLTVKFLMSYGTRPIQVFGLGGLVVGGAGTLLATLLSYQRIVHGMPLANRPILLLAVVLIVIGVFFVFQGLTAEMIVRTYHESQRKPIYIVREIISGKERDT